MFKIERFWVFVVNLNGQEKIAMYPDKNGNLVPLVYMTKEGIEEDNMREAMQKYADTHKLYFELREYKLVESSKIEAFYPSSKEYNA